MLALALQLLKPPDTPAPPALPCVLRTIVLFNFPTQPCVRSCVSSNKDELCEESLRGVALVVFGSPRERFLQEEVKEK